MNAQVLPAGVYLFRLLDSFSDRHIVQVFNKDESQLYATILAIHDSRLRANDRPLNPKTRRSWNREIAMTSC